MSLPSPCHDSLLVKMDPIPEKQGSLIILEDSSPNRVRTGQGLKVGPGVRNEKTGERTPVGIEQGEKVAFFRWNLEHQNGKRIASFLEAFGEDLGLIRARDILLAWAPGEEVQIT